MVRSAPRGPPLSQTATDRRVRRLDEVDGALHGQGKGASQPENWPRLSSPSLLGSSMCKMEHSKGGECQTRETPRTIKICTADSRLLRSLEGAVVRGAYPPMTFHAVKDLSAAVDSGRRVQQAMPVTSLSVALYQLAHDTLGGLRTSTEVVRYFLDD